MASNNIVTIRGDRDLLDSLKRLKNIDGTVLSDKLNPDQQEAIVVNRALVQCLLNKVRLLYLSSAFDSTVFLNAYCLVEMTMLQTDECRESLDLLKERFPSSKATAEIIVLLAIKEHSPAAAVEQLEVRRWQLCTRHPPVVGALTCRNLHMNDRTTLAWAVAWGWLMFSLRKVRVFLRSCTKAV